MRLIEVKTNYYVSLIVLIEYLTKSIKMYIKMVDKYKRRTVGLVLCDLKRLDGYKNKSETIRKALDIFIEREKRTDKNTKRRDVIETNTTYGMEKKKLEYIESLCINTETDSRRYYSVSEVFRVALRDFWEIEDSPILEPSKPDTRDYLERNGIKVLRVLE